MKPLIILFSLFISVVVMCCKDSGLEVIRSQPDPRVLNTDEDGRILGGDRSDWCGTYGMTYGPVYPNPANSVIKGHYTVPQRSFVDIYFKDDTGFETVIYRDTLQAGSYTTYVNVSDYMKQKWFLKLYVNIGDQHCSGDVQFY